MTGHLSTSDDFVDCSFCQGTGTVPDPRTEGIIDTICPVCKGQGEIYYDWEDDGNRDIVEEEIEDEDEWE